MTAQTEECEPRGGRYDLTPKFTRWRSDSALRLSDVAGARADAALNGAVRTAARTAPEDCANFVGDTTNLDWAAGNIDHWYLARDRGRWRAFAFGHVYGSECTFEAPSELQLPRAVVGHDALRPSWTAIVRALPGAVDAIASPNGDLVVAFTADSLFAFGANGTTLGARLLALPFARERIVMTQWATGRNVERWTREIAKLGPRLGPARVTR
jgi:hypothetical protein